MKTFFYLVASLRALIIFPSMVGYLVLYSVGRIFKKHNPQSAFALRRFWLNSIGIPVLNIHIIKEGKVSDRPAIYMGNHRSFADPIVICRYLDAFVIAKAEVANYPIINKGAEITGVIWVDRNNKNSRKETRGKLVETFEAGHNILVFPEGTVGTQSTTLPFKMGTFIEAAHHGIPIVPFAIEFKSKKDLWVLPKFIPQYFYQFSKWKTEVKISIGSPVTDTDPEKLMSAVRGWVDDKLKEQQKDWSEAF